MVIIGSMLGVIAAVRNGHQRVVRPKRHGLRRELLGAQEVCRETNRVLRVLARD